MQTKRRRRLRQRRLLRHRLIEFDFWQQFTRFLLVFLEVKDSGVLLFKLPYVKKVVV